MPAADEIFPSHKHPDFVQTEWAEGWTYAVMGFAAAARTLTDQRSRMGATVDHIGLAVFYLQRHRVELVLKQALVDLGEPQLEVAQLGHNLHRLWDKLEEVVRAEEPRHWQELETEHGDFIRLIHKADRGSFSYRYPVDRGGAAARRKPFIDLDALDRHAETLENGLAGYTDWLYEMRGAGPEGEGPGY